MTNADVVNEKPSKYADLDPLSPEFNISAQGYTLIVADI